MGGLASGAEGIGRLVAWLGDGVEGLWKRGAAGMLAPSPLLLVGVLARATRPQPRSRSSPWLPALSGVFQQAKPDASPSAVPAGLSRPIS